MYNSIICWPALWELRFCIKSTWIIFLDSLSSLPYDSRLWIQPKTNKYVTTITTQLQAWLVCKQTICNSFFWVHYLFEIKIEYIINTKCIHFDVVHPNETCATEFKLHIQNISIKFALLVVHFTIYFFVAIGHSVIKKLKPNSNKCDQRIAIIPCALFSFGGQVREFQFHFRFNFIHSFISPFGHFWRSILWAPCNESFSILLSYAGCIVFYCSCRHVNVSI